jgi:hypothetical protein
MSYHNNDEFTKFQYILDNFSKLASIHEPFEFLFVHSIEKKVRTDFAHRFFAHKDDPSQKKWQHSGTEWFDVANYISQEVDCKCWFWWEPDVCPVRRDCFDFFMSMWKQDCQIMGYRVKDGKWGMKNKINGVAFYGRHFADYIRPYFNLEGTSDTRKAFHKKTEKGIFVELNRWYSLVHHEGPLLLTPDLRIVHGIKDNSLLKQIVTGQKTYPMASHIRRSIRNRLKILYFNYIAYKKYPPES